MAWQIYEKTEDTHTIVTRSDALWEHRPMLESRRRLKKRNFPNEASLGYDVAKADHVLKKYKRKPQETVGTDINRKMV